MDDYFEDTDQYILKDKIITCAIKHVVFDGWSETTISKICNELALNRERFDYLFPRGGLDLALFFHEIGDLEFKSTFSITHDTFRQMRVRDKIEYALYYRLQIAFHRSEVVRRSLAFFSNPLYIFDGARSIWSTSDIIWNIVGDDSDDLNWYSKRAILATVYSASLLFGLDDDSVDKNETKEFVHRRIEDVMSFQTLRQKAKGAPFFGSLIRKFDESNYSRTGFKKQFPGYKNGG